MEKLTIESIEYQLLMAIHNTKETDASIKLTLRRFKDGENGCLIKIIKKGKVRAIDFSGFDDDETRKKSLAVTIEAIHGDHAAFMKMVDIRHDK